MTDKSIPDTALVPSFEQLQRSVVPRLRTEPPLRHTGVHPIPPGPSFPVRLSREADAFLRSASRPGCDALTLEHHWSALDIASGSTKNRVLAELRGLGFIRLECRGKAKAVQLYDAAWEYLGLRPPKVHGRGGPLHRQLAERLGRHFRRQGYDVRIECEIGPRKKRVDLIAFGKGKRIGIEIALTDVDQELRNMNEDLDSGALDAVLIVSLSPSLLQRIRERAASDPALASRLERVHFHLINPEDLDHE